MTNKEYIFSLNDRQLAELLSGERPFAPGKFCWALSKFRDSFSRGTNVGNPQDFSRYNPYSKVCVESENSAKWEPVPFYANNILLAQIFLDAEYKPEYWK